MERLLDFLRDIPPEMQGFIMSFVIAILRLLYDAKETRRMRIFLEGLICGGLTLCASYIIESMGWPESLCVAAGGAIGFIGVMQLRQMALKYLKIKVK